MKLFRYRKPSINTVLGITKTKKQIKRSMGIYKITKITNAPKNFQRRMLNKVGYYSEPAKIWRNGIRRPGGCMVSLVGLIISVSMLIKGFINK
ncbi:MAG: hypothetical protein Q8903_02330 [Bacteroidota bacterium]|nr:hypothetical protein [Bacteroidota bacterium]